MTEDRVSDKIRKLLALSEDEGASEHEASLAMEMAQKLATQYAIDLAKLLRSEESAGGMGVEFVHRTMARQERQADFWWTRIAVTVGRLYHLPVFTTKHHGYSAVNVAGPEELVDGASDTFHYLVKQVEALYKQNLPRGLSQKDRAQYRKNFKWACASRLVTRASELTQQITGSGKNELVVVSRGQVMDEAYRYLQTEGIHLKRGRAPKHRTGYGANDGFRAADEVSLRPELG